MEISVGNIDGVNKGLVSASYVSSRVFYKDFFNSIRNIFGWELVSYTEMTDNARDEVIKRLIKKVESLDGNALSNLKFEVAYMASGSLSIMGYANAVKVRK